MRESRPPMATLRGYAREFLSETGSLSPSSDARILVLCCGWQLQPQPGSGAVNLSGLQLHYDPLLPWEVQQTEMARIVARDILARAEEPSSAAAEELLARLLLAGERAY